MRRDLVVYLSVVSIPSRMMRDLAVYCFMDIVVLFLRCYLFFCSSLHFVELVLKYPMDATSIASPLEWIRCFILWTRIVLPPARCVRVLPLIAGTSIPSRMMRDLVVYCLMDIVVLFFFSYLFFCSSLHLVELVLKRV